MRNIYYLASTLGNDPHTEGIHNALHIANLAGIEGKCLPPSDSLDFLCSEIKKYSPSHIGLSYRLTPAIGVELLKKTVNYFVSTGLLSMNSGVRVSFSGLPETVEMAKSVLADLPLEVDLVPPLADVMDRAINTLDYFGGGADRDAIVEQLKEELVPPGIGALDELATEVVRNDDYRSEPPLKIPSEGARINFIQRIKESDIPLLRSHFGIPAPTIAPTVEGIEKLAMARVIDELSLGSSDLSQRYFGIPEKFENAKNDGGVPYKNEADLQLLYRATRMGNYPAIKPYCHVDGIVSFIHTCIKNGLLVGAHQAIPLYWFNELDGRGPHTVEESVREHFDGVRELVRMGIPVEMNDPNQWSSRNAHDTIIVTSYALIGAVMTMCAVKDMVVQMQFNKPKETGDYADLAKMRAGYRIMSDLSAYSNPRPRIHLETRTGIESLSPDMEKAKWQLARSTLLQMLMNPEIVHIVSYCEANYAARPEDIIDSSRLIRRAFRVYRKHENDLKEYLGNPILKDREEYLYAESRYLIERIAGVPNSLHGYPISSLAPAIGNPEAIIRAINTGIMSAPGIVNAKYKGHFFTKPTKYGMINLVDSFTNPTVLREKERLKNTITL